MQASACAGDVPSFFAHVDKVAIQTNAAKSMREPGETAREAEAQTAEIMHTLFAVWEREVRKGERGMPCAMTYVASRVNAQGDMGEVRIKDYKGEPMQWTFEKFGERWFLVDIMAGQAP